MIVEFYKGKDQRITLNITRGNGTKTWSKLRQGLEDHDLAHLAVEKTLQLKGAFFGLIESGVAISDFQDKLKQPEISTEAIQVEYLVNLLQTEYWNKGEELDILKVLSQTLEQREIPMLANLEPQLIDDIRSAYHSLINLMKHLKPGEKMNYQISHL